MDWKVLASKRVLDNPWLRVRADDCEMPDGTRIHDYFVLEYADWCNVLALTSAQEVVLVKQYRHGLGLVSLELPGGMVDVPASAGVSAQEAARVAVKRELLEETGYGGGTFTHLASLSPNPATQNNLIHSFLALDVSLTGVQHLDSSEDIEVVLKPLPELIALALRGELMQTMQMSTLLLALGQLGRIDTGG